MGLAQIPLFGDWLFTQPFRWWNSQHDAIFCIFTARKKYLSFGDCLWMDFLGWETRRASSEGPTTPRSGPTRSPSLARARNCWAESAAGSTAPACRDPRGPFSAASSCCSTAGCRSLAEAANLSSLESDCFRRFPSGSARNRASVGRLRHRDLVVVKSWSGSEKNILFERSKLLLWPTSENTHLLC